MENDRGIKIMLKVYCCSNCNKTMYISRETDITCRICSGQMFKLDTSYEEFAVLTEMQREAFIKKEIMYADYVVTGTIFTGEGSIQDAMAVKNGRIVYVGNKRDVQHRIGKKTKLIEAKGMVLPGFTEGHAHVTSAYDVLNYAALYKGETQEEYLEIMKEFLRKHPDTEFLMCRGYRNGVFDENGPRAVMLDEVSTEIPIVAIGEDAHSMWVNTKALELAGIDENTQEMPGGEIVRYQNAKPSGWLKEAADSLIQPILPRLELEKIKEAILYYQKLAITNGITHVFEPMLNPQRDYEVCIRAYEELAREKKLLLNYQTGYTVYPGDDVNRAVRQAVEYRDRANAIGSDRYSLNTIKLFIDGVLEGHTAYLTEPYADRRNDSGISEAGFCSMLAPVTNQSPCGRPLWTQEQLNEAVLMAAGEQFQIHIHTIGDGAVDMAVQAFLAAEKAGYKPEHPHAVTHVQVVTEHQFAQLAELGIVVVVNPYWHFRDTLYFDRLEMPYLGKERAEKEYPVASFVKAGCIVSQASDFPITIPADSMNSLHLMVNRREPGCDGIRPLNAKEALSVEQALTVMTVNGAKQGGIEDYTGSLKEGKDADFVILDKNLLTTEPSQLYTAKVQQVFIKGNCIKNDALAE